MVGKLQTSIQVFAKFPPDHAVLFAQLIARTAKDIDVLIDSLPSEDSSPELQVNNLFIIWLAVLSYIYFYFGILDFTRIHTSLYHLPYN